MKFPLGQLTITRGVAGYAERGPEEVGRVMAMIRRHASGDWGDVPECDAQINDGALRDGERLLSAYDAPEGLRFYVITEADRSATTVLFPSEY